jgi:hypothetical protein
MRCAEQDLHTPSDEQLVPSFHLRVASVLDFSPTGRAWVREVATRRQLPHHPLQLIRYPEQIDASALDVIEVSTVASRPSA